jgi:apolipoprotein N-acyltransferase
VLAELAITRHVGLLVGARYMDKIALTQRDGEVIWQPADQRNTAYLFEPDGTMGDLPGERYDKMHLVPFGEFIPFKHSFPPLYRLFLALGPNYYSDYEIEDGSDNGLTVFSLNDANGVARWKFVTPICFEDVDPQLCAAMFRPGSDGKKKAQFMVNITNDGWFAGSQNMQHLQMAIFRCIENRAAMARSVNTGISGFIDSAGHTSGLVAARTEGTSLMQLGLDSRLTFYTLHGDVFAWLCVSVSALCGIAGLLRKRLHGYGK